MNVLRKSWLLILSLFVANQTVLCQQWLPLGNNLLSEESILEVDISDDGLTVAIGSPFNNNNVGNHGTVKIYNWDGNNWIQKGNLFTGENANDNLGYAVSLNSNGNTVVIGMPNNDESYSDAGKSSVYSWNGSNWVQKGNSILGEGFSNLSGSSVSINNNGDIVAVGAYNNGDNGVQSGHVRVFQWDGSGWMIMGSTIAGEAQGDRSGYSINLDSDGTTLAIGAITNSDGGSSAGHVRVYNYDGSNWVQQGGDIDGFPNERLGRKVSLSGEGNRLVIGASINFDDDTGLARVYEWNGTEWTQVGNDFVGGNQGAKLGSGVALNEDGTVLVIGSPGYEGVLPNNGQIKIYTWQSNSWIENSTFTGTSNGNRLGYDVHTNLSGDYVCFTSSDISQVLKKEAGTSINSMMDKDDLAVKLIPNPAINELLVDARQEIIAISIIGLNGQKLIQKTSSNTINIADLPAGIYLVRINTKSRIFVKRLIKIHNKS